MPGIPSELRTRSVVNGELFAEDVDVAQMRMPDWRRKKVTLGEDEYFVLETTAITARNSRYANIGTFRGIYLSEKYVSAWRR